MIEVTAAILEDGNKIMIARRAHGKHLAGFWEFPGGKVEEGEAVLEALSRELKEELAISVLDAEPFLEVRHDYPEKSVLLDVWEVTRFSGCAVGNEGQPVAWISVDQLNGYQFPEANRPIIAELQNLASKT